MLVAVAHFGLAARGKEAVDVGLDQAAVLLAEGLQQVWTPGPRRGRSSRED